MPTLTLKGIPDGLYQRLKAQAAANHRSLNSEVLVCLEKSVSTRSDDAEEMLARIKALRGSLTMPPFTDEELREAKEWGRE